MTDDDILSIVADAYNGLHVAFIGSIEEVRDAFRTIAVPMGEIARATYRSNGGGEIAFASGGRIDFLVDSLGVLIGRRFDAVYGRYAELAGAEGRVS